MASFIIIRSKVTDFNTWKTQYDSHLPIRVEAGLTEKQMFRNADNPNEIILLFEAEDLNRAREFAGSADLREKMREAGTIDKPDIYFLNG
jgi:hypothetical protein